MLQKIHCNLLDIYGFNWMNIASEQINCIIQSIHSAQLIETANELYGFVGTADAGEVIGGYFIVQFPTELLSFTRDKTALIETTTPAETVLFVLFPRVGRILLQNRHFQILPLNMEIVLERFRDALAQVLRLCNVGPVVSLSPTPITVGKDELIQAFESSARVTRLSVNDPDATQIPENFTYYNRGSALT
jgi:hypothetical protein